MLQKYINKENNNKNLKTYMSLRKRKVLENSLRKHNVQSLKIKIKKVNV